MTTYNVKGSNKFNGNVSSWNIKTDDKIEAVLEARGIIADEITIIDDVRHENKISLYEVTFINTRNGKKRTKNIETISVDDVKEHVNELCNIGMSDTVNAQIVNISIVTDNKKTEIFKQEIEDVAAILSNPTDDELLYEMDVNNCDEITVVEGFKRETATYKRKDLGKYTASLAANQRIKTF